MPSADSVREASGPFRAPGLPVGARLAGVGLLGCALVGLLHLDHLPWTVCFFKAATGLPCPACGTTRTLGRFFALDLLGAFSMNPLAAAAFVGLLGWGVADIAARVRGQRLALRLSPAATRLLGLAATALVALNWGYLIGAAR